MLNAIIHNFVLQDNSGDAQGSVLNSVELERIETFEK